MKLTKNQIGGTPRHGILMAMFLFALMVPFASTVSLAD